MSFHALSRGKNLHGPSREYVTNNSGSLITKSTVVDLNGMATVYPAIKVGNPSTLPNFGIAEADIANGADGFVVCLGFMFEVNTNAWPVNTILYSTNLGVLSTVANGPPVAIVVKQDPAFGVLYVTGDLSNQAQVPGWNLLGNTGTNPATDFLGTLDNTPLHIRTNSLNRVIIDENGHFGIGTTTPSGILEYKTHSDANSSGSFSDTFYLETNDTSVNNLIVIPVSNPSILKIEITVMARQTDGLNRAAWKRSALFYREASNVQIQQPWTSDFTQKSDPTFNFTYIMGVSTITFKVKAASSVNTRWTGTITMQEIF